MKNSLWKANFVILITERFFSYKEMLILRIFGYHFFIFTNYQKILAKFIILITNRFFHLVSRRQRFFYTVCYKLRSQKMRTRLLCFLLCFCFLVFCFHFSSSSFFSLTRYAAGSGRGRWEPNNLFSFFCFSFLVFFFINLAVPLIFGFHPHPCYIFLFLKRVLVKYFLLQVQCRFSGGDKAYLAFQVLFPFKSL